MSEARFLKFIIVALLLLNLGTLAFLWTAEPHHGPPRGRPPEERGGGGRESTAEYLRRNLQLSDAQEERYHLMREAHHAAVMRIRTQMAGEKQALYGLLHQTDTTGAAAHGAVLIDRIVSGQRQIEGITYAHFRELRALCTPAQQQKFDAIIADALERMR